MMKKLLIALAFGFQALFVCAQSDDAVLMKVDNRPVSVGEFKYIYEKNNGKEATYTEKAFANTWIYIPDSNSK